MLNPAEKAYCLALLALRKRDLRAAAEQFDRAGDFFSGDKEFQLLKETTTLALAVKAEIGRYENEEDFVTEEILNG
ncbi:MAG: hypothetical protein AAB305_02810 [Candidatus Zixiibacteriota bacterium]